ncbi:MAG: hypothetical protein V4714_11235 [Bacteroidota bacterium]
MRKIAIIHFSPIELYPPVMNFLNVMVTDAKDTRIDVYTTQTITSILSEFKSPLSNLNIVRIGKTGQQLGVLVRYWNYFIFYFGCFYRLIRYRPHTLLYYETLSSLPALLYKRFINRSVRLLVHYHEYTSLEEYRKNMLLTKIFHRMEEHLYSSFIWISHTNKTRLVNFMADHASVKFGSTYVLPNYPPKSWFSKANCWHTGATLRIIYVGSLGLDTTFIQEFCNWVKVQAGIVTFDIYAYNISEEVKFYISSLDSDYIKVYQAVNYVDLPDILSNYHVGIILYKGHIPNYVHNAPNKLFEYLACGLDVWFPQQLLGSYEYITQQTYPKVLMVDFEHLYEFDWVKAVERKELVEAIPEFYCENVLGLLVNRIKAIL